MTDLIIGALLSVTVAGIATLRGSLSRSGFVTSLGLGTFVYTFAGVGIFGALMLFFISSSLLAKLHPNRKKSRRNGWQVLANGGVLLLLTCLSFVWHSDAPSILMLTSIGVAMSDTWASEIGQKSRALPFHVLTKKPFPPGLSGGVSVLGYMAAFLAALLIGAVSFFILDSPSISLALWISLFSFFGAWVDSVLGLIQVKYRTVSGHLSETYEKDSLIAQGCVWLDNNRVNFLSNVITVCVFGLFLWLF